MALFNHYQVETPESVALEFTLAGIGNRLYALLIDYCCLGVMLIALLLLWGLLAYHLERLDIGGDEAQLWLMAMQLFLLFAVYVGYFVGFETLWQGQTPGKRQAHIRVIREDGRPVGLTQATLRALLRPIDDWLYLGALLIMFSKQEKRLGDWLAGTLVIQESRSKQGDRLILRHPTQALTLAKQLQTEHLITAITPDQWLIIRDYLINRSSLLPKAQQQVSQRLRQQIQQRISLPDPWLNPDPDLLLEAIYLAAQNTTDPN